MQYKENNQILLNDEDIDTELKDYQEGRIGRAITRLPSSNQTADKIAESMLHAMSIIAKDEIKRAEYNRVVKAIVIQCEDPSLGKYKVQYQDGFWYAYSENLSNTYLPGTCVYVMIPNSNMEEDKIIIGVSKNKDPVENNSQNTYAKVESELDSFVSDGQNLLSLIDLEENEWNLWTEYPQYLDSGNKYVKQYIYKSHDIFPDEDDEDNNGGNYLDPINGDDEEDGEEHYLEPDENDDDTLIEENSNNNDDLIDVEQTGLNNKETQTPAFLEYYSEEQIIQMQNLPKQKIEESLNNNSLMFLGNQADITTHLLLSMDVQTKIPISKQYKGNYGLGIKILFKTNDEENVIERNGVKKYPCIQRLYKLDINNMTGNPYNFINSTTQKVLLEVDGKNFIKITQIFLFIKDFVDEVKEEEKIIEKCNIKISNLSLEQGHFMTQEEKNGVVLILKTPKGTIFPNDFNSLSTDTRYVKALVKIQLRDVNTKTQKIPFYWFRQNCSITSKSQNFCKYGGQIWECLNPKAKRTVDGKEEYYFLQADDTFIIKKSDVPAKETKFKCVMVYNNISYSKTFTITNLSAQYEARIESTEGFTFYKDQGRPNLTCIITQNGQELSDTILKNGTFELKWSLTNKLGNVIPLEASQTGPSENSKEQTVYLNKIYNFNIAQVSSFITVHFSIIDSHSKICLASAEQVITNSLTQEAKYSVVINNGTQLFRYGADGILEWNEADAFLPLSYSMYDDKGQIFTDEMLNNVKTQWIVPIKDTLLKIETSSEDATTSLDEETKTFNTKTFVYSVAKQYDMSKSQNSTIILKVNYNGLTLTTRTNFIFSKQGGGGTNGTDYFVRIVPNVTDADANNLSNITPLVYYSCNPQSLNDVKMIPNWQVPNGKGWFKVEIWKNSELLYSGCQGNNDEYDINWGMLTNIIGDSYSNLEPSANGSPLLNDLSFFIISNPKGQGITGADDNFNKSFICLLSKRGASWQGGSGNNKNYIPSPANILQAIVTIKKENNLKCYATFPINTVELQGKINDFIRNGDMIQSYLQLPYRIEIEKDSGFNFVEYTTQGLKPTYFKNKPFKINVFKKIQNNQNFIPDFASRTWYSYSSYYKERNCYQYKNEISNQDNTKQKKIINTTFSYSTNGRENNNYIEGNYTHHYLILKENVLYSQDQKNVIQIQPKSQYDGSTKTNQLLFQIQTKENQVLKDTIRVYIPIHFYLNKYFHRDFNDWDGNSIEFKEDGKNSIILAPQVAAGKKNADNTFTGMLMGSVTKVDGNHNIKEQTGLFGYNNGQQSIFLDANTGIAEFGTSDTGKIIIDPYGKDGQSPKATISSKTYNPSASGGTGMQIDLTTPEIRFGSGNFVVNNKGYITAKGGGTLAGWTLTDHAILSSSSGKTGLCSVASVNSVDEQGNKIGKIVNFKMSSSSNPLERAAAFWAGENPTVPDFFVTHQGFLKVAYANIGAGTNAIFIGKNGLSSNTTDSAIFSGSKITKTLDTNGFYLGTDGLGIGRCNIIYEKDSNGNIIYDESYDLETGEDISTPRIKSIHSNFQVDPNGTFYAFTGYIGRGDNPWIIGDSGLYKGKTGWGKANEDGIFIGPRGISCGSIAKTNNGTTSYTTPFYVQNNGNFKAIKGQIANWTISENSIRTNNASDRYYSSGSTVDTTGIYFGNQGLRMGANFHVDSNGNLYANNGEFTGKITATSGYISSNVTIDGTVTATSVKMENIDVSTGKITVNGQLENAGWRLANIRNYNTTYTLNKTYHTIHFVGHDGNNYSVTLLQDVALVPANNEDQYTISFLGSHSETDNWHSLD